MFFSHWLPKTLSAPEKIGHTKPSEILTRLIASKMLTETIIIKEKYQDNGGIRGTRRFTVKVGDSFKFDTFYTGFPPFSHCLYNHDIGVPDVVFSEDEKTYLEEALIKGLELQKERQATKEEHRKQLLALKAIEKMMGIEQEPTAQAPERKETSVLTPID